MICKIIESALLKGYYSMKNRNRKLICLFMALVFVFGTICAVPASADEQETPKRTIMVYAIGSNLEANSKCFTKKVVEFSNMSYNENLDIIVITGGSLKWNTPGEYLDGADEIDAEYDQVWKVVGKKDGQEHGSFKLIEPTGMPGYEKANMGDAETLTAFMDYCYENYPANIYDIVLWDHGGGPVGGYGHDDRFDTMIRLPGLVSAFADSKLVKDGKKFDMIDFDACLMSNVTVITALGAFTDYLVVSPEVEYAPGQLYLRMLESIRSDPSINGFELGKIMADDFAAYFNKAGYPATLTVIDAKNFKERLLPFVRELDGIFISEAAKTGKKNDRYNFYDEMYSLLYSFVFGTDAYSLYDLGNLVGALSIPMSEMDNISAAERSEFENAYTDVAKRILDVLSDRDESGDDVLYFRFSGYTERTVGAGVVRGANGELVYADDYGKTRVTPTGLSILFPDKNIDRSAGFVTRIKKLLDADYTDEEKDFFKARMTTTAYYSLIFNLGYFGSLLNTDGVKDVSYLDVKKAIEDYGYWDEYCVPLIDWLVESGEFTDIDGVQDYLASIVAQQSFEAITADKVVARPIENADGGFDSYQVTVSGSSAQALMSVEAGLTVAYAGNETPEYLGWFKSVYGSCSLNELYPNGMLINSVSGSGELDLALYYNSANDTLAELYERIYSSQTSVWTLPKITEECLVLYDGDGGAHLIDLHYLDESHEYAYMPLSIYYPEDGGYYVSKLILRYTNDEWSIYGISFKEKDLLSFVVMLSDLVRGDFLVSPGAYMTDSLYNFTAMVPISTYFPIDMTKDDWGLSLGMAKLSELDDVASFKASYKVSDVYGVTLNVDTAVEAANEAAQRGEFVRDISLTDITVADTVYTGLEAAPDVTVTYGGKTLTNGVDYKVIYDGSSEPGGASLAVFGIGDFCGANYLTYTIKDSLSVKVDGTEIGKDHYTVDEDTGAVTLTKEYLQTLAVGDHTMTVILSGAETTTNFTVPAENGESEVSPLTGDDSHIGLWIILMTVSALGTLSLFILDGKQRAIIK